MNCPKRSLAIGLFILVGVSLNSCSSSPPSSNQPSNSPVNSNSPTPSESSRSPAPIPASPTPEPTTSHASSSQPFRPSPTSVPASPTATAPTPIKTVLVDLYEVDSQCLNLVPRKIALPADRSLEAAIEKILADEDSADFSLAGYRTQVKNRVATIELRLAAGAKRQFSSLSACEQLALFGSLRKTLTSNPEWKIRSVRFTEKGKEIVF